MIIIAKCNIRNFKDFDCVLVLFVNFKHKRHTLVVYSMIEEYKE